MATIDDILVKAKSKKKPYQPTKRRAWDFVADVSESSQEETDYKEEQIRNENGDRKGNNREQNRDESGDNNRNNKEQTRDESEDKNRDEIRDKSSNIAERRPNTLRNNPSYELTDEIDEKQQEAAIDILRKTVGYQGDIMAQFTAHIKSRNLIENTIIFSISTLAFRLNTNNSTIRTCLKRLDKKRIISLTAGTRGRYGNTHVIVPNFIIKECLNLFDCQPLALEAYRNENRYEYRNENKNKNGNSSGISSSNNININTTNKVNLPENWSAINVEPLLDIGFSTTQLKQLSSKALNTPEIVQESINHFAFGLENNPKFKNYKEPLNVLMGVLRKGCAWTEPNYRSPQEIALQQLIEMKKAERERMKVLEEEAFSMAFSDWQEKLSDDELEDIAPSTSVGRDIIPKQVKLNLFFKEKIWPQVKGDYLGESE